jgi:hypothetical protein
MVQGSLYVQSLQWHHEECSSTCDVKLKGKVANLILSLKGDGIVDETRSWIVVQSLNVHMKFEYWTQECKHEGDRV